MDINWHGLMDQKAQRNAKLREKLAALIATSEPVSSVTSIVMQESDDDSLLPKTANATLLITLDEVVENHGTGVLLKRIFKDDTNILSVRSSNNYGGLQRFGYSNLCLSLKGCSRQEIFLLASRLLKSQDIQRIFCVPYSTEQLLFAIAVKEIFDVPLVIWIMDDQNITVSAIPDALMQEFLSKASLRLATHPEMRQAYEEKFGFTFWLLPAVAPEQFIQTAATLPERFDRPGILIGSMWSENWLSLLCTAVKGAGCKLDWYGQPHTFTGLSTEVMAQSGITARGLVAEATLVNLLRQAPFVLVPTGLLDGVEDRPDLSLSLPGRILFAMATANTPVIVMGSEQTSAAHFIRCLDIGTVSDYEAASFQQALGQIMVTENQCRYRRNAAAVAAAFSADAVADWIWHSVAAGKASDGRFENLFSAWNTTRK